MRRLWEKIHENLQGFVRIQTLGEECETICKTLGGETICEDSRL